MPHYSIGAALIRKRLKSMTVKENIDLLLTIWPQMPQHLLRMFARHPDELRVNGSELKYPASWDDLASR